MTVLQIIGLILMVPMVGVVILGLGLLVFILIKYWREMWIWNVFILFFIGTLLYGGYAQASTATVSITIPCSNTNWQHSPRCTAPPILETMIINPYGVSSGELTSGVKWTQTRITESMSLFRLEEVCWLTYKDVTVYCEI
jgi:hypothetical protein